MIVLFKLKTAEDMRISDWSSDVCSSDLRAPGAAHVPGREGVRPRPRPPARLAADGPGRDGVPRAVRFEPDDGRGGAGRARHATGTGSRSRRAIPRAPQKHAERAPPSDPRRRGAVAAYPSGACSAGRDARAI